MKTKEEVHGDAYAAVKMIYDKSPGRSWRRLNGALQGALDAAITAHLSFLPDDFRAIRYDMNGGYWLGSDGGERYYNLAVKVGHTPACISFERYAGRPAALWAQDVKTAERLCIGSEFTWKGQRLTVTNMREDYLVACSYERARYRGSDHAIAVGDFGNLNDGKYREIEDITPAPEGATTIRFGPPVDDPYSRKPNRIVKIPFQELAEVRRNFEKSRRDALKQIAAAETLEALEMVSGQLAASPAGTYRHFDIEDFREAITERERSMGLDRERLAASARAARDEAAELVRWANGESLRRYFSTVRLRVNGGRVETSTGQSVSVEAVRRALPVVLRRRNSFGPVCNLMVDGYPVVEQNTVGVKVGCTLVPWTEVEALPGLLKARA